MFSLANESDEPTYQSYSPTGGSEFGADSRSGSQSPSGLTETNNAGSSAITSSFGSSARKRRAQLSLINLNNAPRNESDELNTPSTSGSNANSDEESSGHHLSRSISKTSDPHDKRMRLTSSSSNSSSASLISLTHSDGSQLSLISSDSFCDLTDADYGQNTPSAKHLPPVRSGTIIANGEFELFGSGQETNAVHIATETIYHCMALNQEDYLSFMSVAERIEAAKNRLTSDEMRELRRLIMPEETRLVKAENSKTWYQISPEHQGTLQTFYSAENPSIAYRTHSPWSEHESKAIFRQIVRLVSYCHKIGIYFGDFRLQKLVYTDKKNNLIRVLSLRKIYVAPLIEDDMLPKPDSKCCPAYIAPEMMNLNKPYSAKTADIWSLGILLFVLLTGRFPFVAQKPAQLASLIRKNQWSFKTTDKLSRSARLLVYGLIRQNPAERPSAKEILFCDWFQNQTCEPAPVNCSNAMQPRPQVTVQLTMPMNGRLQDSNPRIPQQLIAILLKPAAERNSIYSSRSNIRASMESFANALHRSMNAENTIQMVPERPQVTPSMCERDSLNITVIRVQAARAQAGARH